MALRQRHTDELAGKSRAVLELSDTMRRQLHLDNVDSILIKEKHLNGRIGTELKGGAISYAYSDARTQIYSFRTASKTWIRKNKWWTAIFILTTLCSAASWVTFFLTFSRLLYMIMLISTGMFPAMIIAPFLTSSTGSRVVFLCYWTAFVVGLIVGMGSVAFTINGKPAA